MAKRLYDDLERAGVSPWLDRRKLLPGQNWKRAIKQAMKDSSYILALLSFNSVSKTGYVQKELREALDLLEHLPPSKIFIIPARLDKCEPVDERLQDLHRVDLFESYKEGVALILQVLAPDRREEKFRESTQLSDLSPYESEQTEKTSGLSNVKRLERAFYEEVPITSPSMKKLVHVLDKTMDKKPHIRSEPLTVSEKEFRKVFGLDENLRPLNYIQNDSEDQGEVVLDHATGLMWQKSGSADYFTYKEAQAYIDELNRKRFADHDEWRLPTIPELMSLLELEKESNDSYINPIFDSKQGAYWSADRRSLKDSSSYGIAYHIQYFLDGCVSWSVLHTLCYVRTVRSRRAL